MKSKSITAIILAMLMALTPICLSEAGAHESYRASTGRVQLEGKLKLKKVAAKRYSAQLVLDEPCDFLDVPTPNGVQCFYGKSTVSLEPAKIISSKNNNGKRVRVTGELTGATSGTGFTLSGASVSVISAVKSVSLIKKKASIALGGALELKAKVKPSSAEQRLKWSSSAPDVATVDSNGVVTAVACGTSTITAKSPTGKKAKCKVTVTAPEATNTPYASSTPAPTNTISPTNTPAPTSTPAPTNTISPTSTPRPNNTQNPTTTPGVSLREYAERIVELVNIERAAVGLNPLALDETLMPPCAVRAEEIKTQFSHTRPDGSSCFTAITRAYAAAGENIAYGQHSPESVMTSWMNSDGHRQNILSDSFGNIGVGVYEIDNTLYWVQLFTN